MNFHIISLNIIIEKHKVSLVEANIHSIIKLSVEKVCSCSIDIRLTMVNRSMVYLRQIKGLLKSGSLIQLRGWL